MNSFFGNIALADQMSRPSQKKPIFPVDDALRKYLVKYGREVNLPVTYRDLQRFTYTVPLKDKKGNDTSWEKVSYDMREWEFLRENLVRIYAILKTEGDMSFSKHLDVARIDFCYFGNSQPFRIRIVNKFNDNYDHYYIKQADASRVYGLELEHLLSPNRMTYFTNNATLIEEHIPGIPGDIFINEYLNNSNTNLIRLAKEFVKFNERCFVQLLGDMRSYNFVVNITPDIEDVQYRIRAIDFDQQSYEGRKNLYLPQFFKDNRPFVDIVQKHLDQSSIAQYQTEERTMMTFRLVSARYRMKELLDIMSGDQISKPEKLEQLKRELGEHFQNPAYFSKSKTMGQLVKRQLKQTLQKNLLLVPKMKNRQDD
ncbi:hypothetical protein SAMN05444410_101154 [Hydrobacter penzbergensis]|uniref:Uncharacterized protein n=1 Tax=Hydrobacter penzbergensis TaxID=1235997 RepID=A0A8X8IBX2_9BACT|nr:hypothetical protein [Hydrobacter penzbergensis]SDW06580.1 hypothetical protein SAMN05444410_101154 [Hydrobacter penzbergensis]